MKLAATASAGGPSGGCAVSWASPSRSQTATATAAVTASAPATSGDRPRLRSVALSSPGPESVSLLVVPGTASSSSLTGEPETSAGRVNRRTSHSRPGSGRPPPAVLVGAVRWDVSASVLVGPEVEVLQGDRLAAGAGELVVVGVVAGHGVRRGAGLLGGLHPDVAVPLEAGARRDQLADDDVLLQTAQRVGASVDRRVGEDAGGLLEGGRGQPRLGRERGLGDAHELGTTRGRLAALGDHAPVLLLEPNPV